MRATTRRAIGATIRIVGKARDQLKAQDVIHWPNIPSTNPSARRVAMPETTQDISPDTMRPKTIGAKRAGIIGDAF